MKGADVSDEAMRHAAEFLEAIGKVNLLDGEDRSMQITAHRFVRIVAWYGEIRAASGNKIAHGEFTLNGKPLRGKVSDE